MNTTTARTLIEASPAGVYRAAGLLVWRSWQKEDGGCPKTCSSPQLPTRAGRQISAVCFRYLFLQLSPKSASAGVVGMREKHMEHVTDNSSRLEPALHDQGAFEP